MSFDWVRLMTDVRTDWVRMNCAASDYSNLLCVWLLSRRREVAHLFAPYTTWKFNAIWLFDVDLSLTRIWVEMLVIFQLASLKSKWKQILHFFMSSLYLMYFVFIFYVYLFVQCFTFYIKSINKLLEPFQNSFTTFFQCVYVQNVILHHSR